MPLPPKVFSCLDLTDPVSSASLSGAKTVDDHRGGPSLNSLRFINAFLILKGLKLRGFF